MAQGSALLMPKLGLTMTEGNISEWLITPGETFRKGDILLVVETEKIANEIEAPADGVLFDILTPAGETVPVGTPIARWDIGGGGAGAATVEDTSAAPAEPGREETAPPLATNPPAAPRTGETGAGARIIATPLARRLARQNSLDLAAVSGSGPRGRIKAEDVKRALSAEPARASVAAATAAAATAATAASLTRAATAYEATVARRLTEAKRDTPHFYLATEANVGRLIELKEQLEGELDLKISINHLIIAAVARALESNPKANSVWRDGQIVQFASIDIGMAVNTDKGLYAPVLRDLGDKDIRSLAEVAREMVARARGERLTGDDLAGGATTISNAGMFDVTYMSSIINSGQSSILGVGSIRDVFRPNKKGKPVLCREMGLVLSCDHRIFDGVSGLAFLNSIKSYLEKPLQLLIN